MIGWLAVLAAGAAEIRWRNALGAAAAAIVGLLTLAAAQALTPSGIAEWIRLGQQTGLWLAMAATAALAAACVTSASRRQSSSPDRAGLLRGRPFSDRRPDAATRLGSHVHGEQSEPSPREDEDEKLPLSKAAKMCGVDYDTFLRWVLKGAVLTSWSARTIASASRDATSSG